MINKYFEILKLDNILTENKMSHEIELYKDGFKLYVPNKLNPLVTVNEYNSSDGYKNDLLEIQGYKGGLSKYEVFRYISVELRLKR